VFFLAFFATLRETSKAFVEIIKFFGLLELPKTLEGIFMQRAFGLILLVLILIASCASFQKKKKINQNIDGIIFLDEDEEKKAAKKKTNKKKETFQQYSDGNKNLNKKQEKTEEVRNLKDVDGIIFLDTEDQANEVAGQAFTPSYHKFERGKASFYSNALKGNKTASGEIYNPNKFTAAHPTLPFGTKVLVTNLYNGNSIVVRINDRGPRVKSRIIDLSYAAAQQLEMIESGITDVTVEVIESPELNRKKYW
jgi:rare lipoprotein A